MGILDNDMHGSRKGFRILTAKLSMDEIINKHREARNKVAVINTDLSAAYATVCHSLLLAKLDHIGIRGRSQKFMTNFLNQRKFYTECQGFFSKLYDMPDYSVVQGSKMSSLLYNLFTIETIHVDKIITDKETYRRITGET